jgi:hypothetical protein
MGRWCSRHATTKGHHDWIPGVKSQVVAQYGLNSDELAALGLKKNGRKAPVRAVKPVA